MSLDLALYQTEDGQEREIASLNWFRNPFGLERWAEANTGLGKTQEVDLWDVCNNYAYGKAEVDRPLFLETVQAYHDAVQALEEGYFYFSLPEYRQFVEPNRPYFTIEERPHFAGLPPRIMGERYSEDGRLMIPVWQFANVPHHGPASLDHYKAWMGRLLEFAQLLQNPATRFYCSN